MSQKNFCDDCGKEAACPVEESTIVGWTGNVDSSDHTRYSRVLDHKTITHMVVVLRGDVCQPCAIKIVTKALSVGER